MKDSSYNSLTAFDRIHLRTLVSDWALVGDPWWVYVDWKPLLSQTHTRKGLQFLRPTEYAAILNINQEAIFARDSLTATPRGPAENI